MADQVAATEEYQDPAETKAEEAAEEKDQDILAEATTRFTAVYEDDGENRRMQLQDTRFVYMPGAQWDNDIRTRRTDWNEPCLEFNQLPQFVNEVVNDARQNRPAIKVDPANGKASKEVAEIQQGLIRGIEYESQAEAVYDNGIQGAVVGGRGWWYVDSEWVPGEFYQKIVIRPILDPQSVRASMDYQQPDGSDRNFVFIVQSYTKEDFMQKWPKAEPSSFEDAQETWRETKDLIYVARYYRRVCMYRTLVQMSDGAVGWKDEMPKPPDGVFELHSREAEVYKIEWYTIAGGNQILERGTWPGEIIPVVCVPGEDMLIDGKRIYQGLIRRMRDAQSMYNFGMTAQAIHLALTPRAPWVAPQEAIEDYQEIYKNANNTNVGVLPYKHKDKDGDPIPAPTRTQPSMPDAGWINWTMQMQGVMKSTAGIYENSLGQKSQETSRVAIVAKEKQGDKATFHYLDNQNRAIALTGRIIIPAIPVFYDTERIVHIIGPDDARKMVTLNQTAPHPSNPLQAIKLNNVTEGEYAIRVETGPGYTTARQEAATVMTELATTAKDPATAAVLSYAAMKNADFYGSDEVIDLITLTLPPPVQQALAAKKEGRSSPDPQTMRQIQEMSEKLQQATAALQELTAKNAELESGARIEQMKVQAKAQADQLSIRADAETDRMKAAEEARLEMERVGAQTVAAQRQAELDRNVAEEKARLARWEAEQEIALKRSVADAEIALDREKAAAAHAAAMAAAANKTKPGKGAAAQ